MNPLNDDELNSLLEQAKGNPPQPCGELAARTLRAYQANVVRPMSWRRYLLRPVSIPWSIGVLAAVLFILIGALVDHSFHRPATIAGTGSRRALSSQSTAILTFKEFQPVSEIRPRVIRSVRDDQ